VLDLKSGWWSGDGGRFVETALEKLKGRCDEPTTVDYHHLLGGDDAPADIAQYGQIWLLSGSTGDPMDYELDDPELVSLIAKIKGSRANLLIGAGFGSVSHANALGEALGAGKLFEPRSEEGDDLFYDEDDRHVVSTITPSVASSPFFAGVGAIADTIELDGDTAKSDAVVASGASAIASGIATLQIGGRTVLLDAGLQRFYAIGLPEAKDTETYLLDIAATLAGD
jgi:hypothetical protein